ncbi:MAG TPA: NFACT family protein [Anaeromyxobacteraceae bacterium]|nr:NFACT family protein [Anaeromyxobacteraceae bacterium]
MSLSARELEALVAELQPLVGARVDAVRVHAERALTLELHVRGQGALLLLSAEPDVTRLHVAAARPPQPETPFGWQGLLRKELEGARLAAIELVPGDRVVALAFERAAGPLRLVGELTGRHGNLFLVGSDGLVRASAGRNLSTRRDLAPGRPYVAPTLVSPNAAPSPQPSPPGGERGQIVEFPLSAEVERRYLALEAERRLHEARRRLREPLRAAAARARRALEKLADEAARVPAAEGDRRLGDLLKANLHAVRRGAPEVELTEWTAEGARPVRVALDPALGPRENMERSYRRFRRIAESAARVAARAAEVRQRAEAVAALLAEVERAPEEALPRLEKEARRLGAGPRPAQVARRRRDAPLPPYRAFRSLAGLAILVGRGAAENDELTKRVARGNDLWLHARGQAGAHVVVRLGKAPIDQETLLDAAHLAVHFSDARGEPQAEVASTRAKYVKKPKGSALGAVTYSQEKVLLLRVEPRRLERLLAEEETPEA